MFYFQFRYVVAFAILAMLAGCKNNSGSNTLGGGGNSPFPNNRTQTELSKTNSSLTLSSTVNEGALLVITTQLRQTDGQPYSLPARMNFKLTGTGTSEGTFSTSTYRGNGKYETTFTATKAGSMVNVEVNVDSKAVNFTLRSQLTVTAKLAVLSVTNSSLTPGALSTKLGSTIVIRAELRDTTGAPFVKPGLVLNFALSGAGSSAGSFSAVTDNNDGTYDVTFTGTAAGTGRHVILDVPGYFAGMLSASQIQVTPLLSKARSTLTVIGNATAPIGNAIRLRASLNDSLGNNFVDPSLAVNFKLSGAGSSNGTFGAVTNNNNGTYDVLFTGTTAGTPTDVEIDVVGASNFAGLKSLSQIQVTPLLSKTNSTVAATAASIINGSTMPVKISLKDSSGNLFVQAGLILSLNLSGGTSAGTFTGLVDNGNGTYDVTFNGTVAGTPAYITVDVAGGSPAASFTGLTSTGQIQVTPALSKALSTVIPASSSVSVGSTITVRATLNDTTGALFKQAGLTLSFKLLGIGTSNGTFGAVTDNGDGTYDVPFTGTTSGSPDKIVLDVTGPSTFTGLQSVSTIQVPLAGIPAISKLNSSFTIPQPKDVIGNKIPIIVELKDAINMPITTAGLNLNFKLVGGSATSTVGTFGPVQNLKNGRYMVEFSGTKTGTAITVEVDITGGPMGFVGLKGLQAPTQIEMLVLDDKHMSSVFYKLVQKSSVQLYRYAQMLLGVGNAVSLNQALMDVRDKDLRRLFIPYWQTDRYVLIAIAQHLGKMIYLDPTGAKIPASINTELKQFCTGYLIEKFKLPLTHTCTIDDLSIAQTVNNDDGTATLMNINDLLNISTDQHLDLTTTAFQLKHNHTNNPTLLATTRVANARIAKRDPTYRPANPLPDVKNKPSDFTNTGLTYAVLPYYKLNSAHLGTFTKYTRPASAIAAEELGSIHDPITRPIIKSINVPRQDDVAYKNYYDALDYQQYFNAAYNIDKYWATRPPSGILNTSGIVNPHYPPVGCKSSNPDFGNATKCLPRVSGYVFRGDARNITTIKANDFTPPSYYALDIAHAVARSGGLSPWNKTWGKSVLYTNTGAKVTSTAVPSVKDYFHDVTVTFRTALTLPPVMQLMTNFNSATGGNWGSKNDSLFNSFFHYTILNPYIHTLIPRAKGFLSTTKSLLVAKGFAGGSECLKTNGSYTPSGAYKFNASVAGINVEDKFRSCAATSWKPSYIYAIFMEGGFDLPQPNSDPWDPTKDHVFRIFHEQEIPVPGEIPQENVAGYADVNNGKLGSDIYLSDDVQYKDPRAFRELHERFFNGE